MTTTYRLEDLPTYLQSTFARLPQKFTNTKNGQVDVLDINQIYSIEPLALKHAHLLLRRHHLTEQIAASGVVNPPLLLKRAHVYEALGYADLAAADSIIVYTLCETVRSEEWISDLEPCELSGEAWPSSDDTNDVLPALVEALLVLCTSLMNLGATQDAHEKYLEMVERYSEFHKDKTEEQVRAELQQTISGRNHFSGSIGENSKERTNSRFGASRREIYPWNEHEPDRNSAASVQEINQILTTIAPNLEAKVTALPALNKNLGGETTETWYQLGLFANKDLAPSTIILREKSILTGIRPLEDAICDACGADLESISREDMRQCPGEECDTTFCSGECASRAAVEYHKPNVSPDSDDDNDNDEADDTSDADESNEQAEEDYPPSTSPFCGNTALQEIGRTSSTNTPEWDLYFLLLTRTIQISITRDIHPLDLPEIKFLWGDFSPAPSLSSSSSSTTTSPTTLPFSLYHNISLPLQFFETLMHSLPETSTPYKAKWLARFDWWVIQTLYAKFRGVANAQQSTYDGKPEIAAVHPMWCLANHSCAPNVRWTPTGVRKFMVLTGEEKVWEKETREGGEGGEQWNGIKAGDEIWSHYTDVRLGVEERREKLQEVLGGTCRCERCLREAERQ